MTPHYKVNIMVKVTLHDNLVPSSRDLWVRDHPFHDLTHNYVHATRLIRAAANFFHLKRDAVIYSGYIAERTNGEFRINLWHEGALIRSLSIDNLGYSGALHAETVGGDLGQVVGYDMLSELALDGEPRLAAAA